VRFVLGSGAGPCLVLAASSTWVTDQSSHRASASATGADGGGPPRSTLA
jgi:hypothetical protein